MPQDVLFHQQSSKVPQHRSLSLCPSGHKTITFNLSKKQDMYMINQLNPFIDRLMLTLTSTLKLQQNKLRQLKPSCEFKPLENKMPF